MPKSTICVLVLLSGMLCACGNKGDLTLDASEVQTLSREAMDRLSAEDNKPADNDSDDVDPDNRPVKKPRP